MFFKRFCRDFTGYFTKSEKSMIIKYILQLEHYEEGSPETPGLKKLMSDGIITDAYPLHNVSISYIHFYISI